MSILVVSLTTVDLTTTRKVNGIQKVVQVCHYKGSTILWVEDFLLLRSLCRIEGSTYNNAIRVKSPLLVSKSELSM